MWMSKRLGPYQPGGVFYFKYPLKGIAIYLSLAGDKKFTLLSTGKALTAFASGLFFKNIGLR
ncbi:hypothetical protein C9381_11680 [Pantoea vagans]|uniref:Uncharacterized protein n=1 Tax=Pantoea vagans TaxID=470934 RepID=A0AAN1NR54_9GAMM|nr:hypothetical protein C9381_11680 [Pantoea vagans]